MPILNLFVNQYIAIISIYIVKCDETLKAAHLLQLRTYIDKMLIEVYVGGTCVVDRASVSSFSNR